MYNSSPKPYGQPFWVHFRVAVWFCVKTSPRANHSYENEFRPPSGSFKLKLNLFSYERLVSPRGTKWLANGQHPFFIRRLFFRTVNILISQRITFLFSKVSGVWIVFISSFEASLPACLQALKPDMKHVTSCRNAICIEHTPSDIVFAFWLVLPFTERKNFVRFSLKHIIALC